MDLLTAGRIQNPSLIYYTSAERCCIFIIWKAIHTVWYWKLLNIIYPYISGIMDNVVNDKSELLAFILQNMKTIGSRPSSYRTVAVSQIYANAMTCFRQNKRNKRYHPHSNYFSLTFIYLICGHWKKTKNHNYLNIIHRVLLYYSCV
jgi:hypothetical protein